MTPSVGTSHEQADQRQTHLTPDRGEEHGHHAGSRKPRPPQEQAREARKGADRPPSTGRLGFQLAFHSLRFVDAAGNAGERLFERPSPLQSRSHNHHK
ncbi:MAG: hypothetical protein ACK559_24005, partial [bacterium]